MIGFSKISPGLKDKILEVNIWGIELENIISDYKFHPSLIGDCWKPENLVFEWKGLRFHMTQTSQKMNV